MVDFGFRSAFEPVRDVSRVYEWLREGITPMDLGCAQLNLYPGVIRFQLVVDSAIRRVATDET